MREKILASIRDINPWILTGIAVILAVILTTGLNYFFSWLEGGKINPRVFVYATIDAVLIPLIIAPIIINMLKRVIDLEQEKQDLEGKVEHHHHAQRVAEQRVANLQAISNLALDCTAAEPGVNLHKLIAEKLQVITGALGVSIAEYSSQEKVLITRHVNVSGDVLSTLNNILGRNIIGLRSPISPEIYQQISKEIVTDVSDLYEVSFGAIPKSVSTVIQKTFGIGYFIGMGFMYSGELWGTAVIAVRKEHPSIDHDMAMALANVAAMAMRRQKTEEALQASQARYRALVEMSPDAITLADLAGKILFCNQKTADVHGYSSVDQIVGTNVLDYFAPEEHAGVLQQLQNALSTRQIGDTPFTLVKKDGSRFPGEIRAGLISGTDSNPIGIIGITRDITERNSAVAEREALIRELETKNDELERFTYTVSHDLKSPLITIGGFLGYLEEDARTGEFEKLHQDIQHINNAATKMKVLLDELLELSRIGRLMNPPEEVPFEKLVLEAMDNVRGQIEARGVAVKLEPSSSSVYGDRQRLIEVLQNLIDNAVKFMGDQSNPQIEIGQRSVEAGKAIFYVKDNGIGIPPEQHERVFDLFNKLDVKTEGTGIGLALVKRIVEFHGGRIWVESAARKGSTFYFTLPVSATENGTH
jgi:PAS domain S-box-containing protein